MTQAPVSFAGFRFDPSTGELAGPNGSVRLAPQPSQLLALLISRRGSLVTRAELKTALWPDTVVEADQGLNFCIRQIRSALGDDAGEGRIIETLPRRGYRFTAPLDTVRPDAVSLPSTPVAPSTSRSGSRYLLGIAIAAAVAVTGAFIGRSGAQKNRNVAILPLLPRAGDPSWVADVTSRLTEQLIVQLTARAPGVIGVVGPATTAPLLKDSLPHTALGRSLDVGYVMSGAVRPSDSTVFIQLIRVSDGVHVYALRRPALAESLDSLAKAVVAGAATKILEH